METITHGSKFLKIILVALAVMCLAQAGLAEPIYVNLLPEGNKKEKIEVPLQAAELSPTINNMLADLEAITNEMRMDRRKHYVDLPIYKADKRTLSAIANALMAMQKLKQSKKEYRFRAMKSIVKDSCFPTSKPATSTDLLNFLLVANFLDIGDLLRPTAAAWVDLKQKEVSLKKITKAQLNTMLPKHEPIPQELLPFFEDYVDWLNNPTSFIKPIGQPIKVGSRPGGALAVVGNKLYVANFSDANLSVIDIFTDQVIGKPIEVGMDPNALAVAGNKLYVANLEPNGTIRVINPSTDQVIGDPIPVGREPNALAVAGNKLYVANREPNGTIRVIDLATHVIGDPIKVGRLPEALAVAGNKLYVGNRDWKGALSVINLATDRVIGSSIILEGIPLALTVVGNKLYVVNSNSTLSVIDTATDRVIGDPIKVGSSSGRLAVAGNKLYVGSSIGSTLLVIDTATDRVIGDPVEVGYGPHTLTVVGNKLYVAKRLDANTLRGAILAFDLEMFNYYN